MKWMNCHKLNSETDDKYLHRSEKLQAQIDDNMKNSHHIQLMIFFKGMNSVIRWKIHKYSVFLNSCEDLMTLVKKLCFSVDLKISIWTVSVNFTENLNMNFSFKWKK